MALLLLLTSFLPVAVAFQSLWLGHHPPSRSLHTTQQQWIQHGKISTTMSTAEKEVHRVSFVDSEEDRGNFNYYSIGSPSVHRFGSDSGERWLMWFNGRDKSMDEDGIVNICTGRVYQATSTDGIHWRRTRGIGKEGSVLDVNEEQWWGFDTAHVGLGHVSRNQPKNILNVDRGVYYMYYMGGSFEESDVKKEFGLDYAPVATKGIRTRIGVAISQDGINFGRVEGENADGSVIDVGKPGEWDEMFVMGAMMYNFGGKQFRLTYHSLDPKTKKFTIGWASSENGVLFVKKGPMFCGGPQGSFDEGGASRRSIERIGSTYYMLYEAVDGKGEHSIGLATSTDGVTWARASDIPILTKGTADWEAGGVSSPELAYKGGGTYYLYYCGVKAKGSGGGTSSPEKGELGGIGIAVAYNNDLTKWRRLTAEDLEAV